MFCIYNNQRYVLEERNCKAHFDREKYAPLQHEKNLSYKNKYYLTWQ